MEKHIYGNIEVVCDFIQDAWPWLIAALFPC